MRFEERAGAGAQCIAGYQTGDEEEDDGAGGRAHNAEQRAGPETKEEATAHGHDRSSRQRETDYKRVDCDKDRGSQ
jgi:hypothetical protein